MVRYEVRLDAEVPLCEALERYMRERHVPEIVATGCFGAVHFDRSGETRFRSVYFAATKADLDRYLSHFAPALRADFLGHFPRGVHVTREIWEELERWGDRRPGVFRRGGVPGLW